MRTLLVLLVACSSDVRTKTPDDFDALAELRSRKDSVKDGRGILAHDEGRMGMPTFIWADRATNARVSLPADVEGAARKHLADYAGRYQLTDDGVTNAKLSAVHLSGESKLVTFKQEVRGVEVFRNRLSIMMDGNNDAVALGGYLSPHEPSADFSLAARDALTFAFLDLTGEALGEVTESQGTPYTAFTGELISARTKPVMFDLPDTLVPAFYLELESGGEHFAYVIGADSGRILFRKDLTAHAAFTYTVWADDEGVPLDSPFGKATPHPTGVPDGYAPSYVAPRNVTVEGRDPWLAADATQTSGNNVVAYADLKDPAGLGDGDLMPFAVSPYSFARSFDPTMPPTQDEQRMAAATHIFYVTNFLHDWFYDVGFDEASGNAQLINYGRGGVENDVMLVETQDYAWRNNAMMSTPADGASPTMQFFLWDANKPSVFAITEPASLAREDFDNATAAWFRGAYDVSGEITVVGSNGCDTPWPVDVQGKIALIDRGGCTYDVKANHAIALGARALIVANNQPGWSFAMPAPGPLPLPAVMVQQSTGDAIKTAGTVRVHMHRPELKDRDSAVDNLIVAHEWSHYMTNRLVGDSSGLTSQQGHAMGEGWGDFVALLLTTRESDRDRPANDRYRGVYAAQSMYAGGAQSDNSSYFGYRRVPYSVDFSKNALTFKHISDTEPLPTSTPLLPNIATNAEVHNSGEVWATMMWECYVALLQNSIGPNARYSFKDAQDRMKRYLVTSLKLMPMGPTFLEARDALLAAAYANDPNDFVTLQRAFARRGAGIRAIGPDRYSKDNSGIVESYISGNDVSISDVSIVETASRCRADGIIDNGDTATVSLTVKNSGIGFLSGTTVRITSSTPGVALPSSVTLPPMDPLDATTVQFQVGVDGLSGITRIDLTLSADDPTLALGKTTVSLPLLGNFDELPFASKTDDVEAPTSTWLAQSGVGGGAWTREARAIDDHLYLGPDLGGVSDLYLVSPALEVGAGDFVLAFRHTYAFESTYDGGVVELSADGSTWVDVGAPLYTGTLLDGTGNPLQGRAALTSAAEGYPALQPVTLNLGSSYAGRTIRIRFRVGSDGAGGDTGWLIDDISLNSVNTPFSIIVADQGCH